MIIDGKKTAEKILAEISAEIDKKNLNLKLGAVVASGDLGLKKFVELKQKASEKAGISFEIFEFNPGILGDELKEKIKTISNRDDINGLLVELPLPRGMDRQKVLNAVPPQKDADVLTDAAQNKFYSGNFEILPPSVEAVKIIFEKYGVGIKGKKAAVFGQGMLVGKPISFWLSQMGAEVFKIDEFTANPEVYSAQSDIVISGVGKPGLISAKMIKEGAVVVDFGYGKKAGKISGDVEFDSVYEKAPLITPVPGGVGPLVIAAVLKNLVMLNKKSA